MAVPKKRTSKTKRDSRKANWKRKANKAARKSLSLAKSVFGPTEAMQKFNEVVSSSADKIKQLDEANDKLESKYYGVLISQEQAKKGVEKLTIARLEEIKATAENFANVEKYANTLKVTSGIVGEFADAVDGLAAEMRKEEEPGFLQSLVSYTTGGVFSAVQAAIRGIKSAFIALKEVLTDNIITKASIISNKNLLQNTYFFKLNLRNSSKLYFMTF